jgi:hypothetical protein
MTHGALRIALSMLIVTCLVTRSAEGQLLSPGRLSAAHQQIDGLRNCTSCHELGKRGVSAERCTSCHQTVATRIAAGSGYHATVPENACATCHQDHLGVDFEMVRFDTGSFEHDDVGYALELSHAELDCRACHEAAHIRDPAVVAEKVEHGALDKTFLGLPTECVGCHRQDDPHGAQFAGRACGECHDGGAWDAPSGFDHSNARFQLDGMHTEVECAQCHGSGETARYAGLAFGACSDCHADPHGAAMAGTCASCHVTRGWSALSPGVERSFDHSRTSFPLRGAHATTDCASCHRVGRAPSSDLLRMAYQAGTSGRTYPLPVAQSCSSCHVNRHVFPAATERWIRCADCHSEAVWEPSSFGAARHAHSTFALTGAHETTPCIACHLDPSRGHARFTLAVPAERCESCHAEDDPHGDLYVGLECVACHTTEAFEEVSFAHEPRPTTCAGCHVADDPHGDQFVGRDCATCHGVDAFTIAAFDHSTTRYPLDGAHRDAPCAACHTTSADTQGMVRYRPLGTECGDCHGESR